MPASRAAHQLDRVAAGKTTWYGEGLQVGADAPIVVNPVASLQMGDLCKAVVTHGKASADSLNGSQLKGRAKPIQ